MRRAATRLILQRVCQVIAQLSYVPTEFREDFNILFTFPFLYPFLRQNRSRDEVSNSFVCSLPLLRREYALSHRSV